VKRALDAIRRWHLGQLAVFWAVLVVLAGTAMYQDRTLAQQRDRSAQLEQQLLALELSVGRSPSPEDIAKRVDMRTAIAQEYNAARRRWRSALVVLLGVGLGVTWVWLGARKRA
jgi:hypothetical protein